MAKKLAMVFGVIFVIVGLLGFVSNPIVGKDALFHTDMVHNIVHLAVGVVMILMAGKAGRLALNLFGAIYLLLAVLGFVMGEGKLLGIMEINQADNWLHLVLGVVLLGAGMSAKNPSSPASPVMPQV